MQTHLCSCSITVLLLFMTPIAYFILLEQMGLPSPHPYPGSRGNRAKTYQPWGSYCWKIDLNKYSQISLISNFVFQVTLLTYLFLNFHSFISGVSPWLSILLNFAFWQEIIISEKIIYSRSVIHCLLWFQYYTLQITECHNTLRSAA